MNRTDPIIDLIPYLISNRGTAFTPIFRDDADYHHMLKVLATTSKQENVRILARSLASEEFQLILEQNAGGSISRMMHRVQTSVARRCNRRYRRSGRLFAGPYQNSRIRSPQELQTIIASFQRLVPSRSSEACMASWTWIHDGVANTLSAL